MINDRATTGKENKTVVALEPTSGENNPDFSPDVTKEIMSFAKEKRAEIIPQHLFLNFFPKAKELRRIR